MQHQDTLSCRRYCRGGEKYSNLVLQEETKRFQSILIKKIDQLRHSSVKMPLHENTPFPLSIILTSTVSLRWKPESREHLNVQAGNGFYHHASSSRERGNASLVITPSFLHDRTWRVCVKTTRSGRFVGRRARREFAIHMRGWGLLALCIMFQRRSATACHLWWWHQFHTSCWRDR